MADATVTLSADLSQLRRELAKIPNLSGDAAQSALVKLEKAVVSAEKAAKRSTTAIKRQAAQQAREYEQSFERIKTGSEKVFGGIVGDVVDVGRAIETLGVAGSAVAGLGLAVGAVGALGLAAVDAIRDVDEMQDRLAELGVVSSLTAEDLSAVEAAARSLDTLEGVGIRIREGFAGAAAPGIREVSQAMLAGSDVAEGLGAALGRMTTSALRGAQVVVAAYEVFGDVLRDLGPAALVPGVAFGTFASRLDEVVDAAVDNVRAGAEVQASLATTGEVVDKTADKTRKYATATREMARALAEIQKIQDAAQSDVKIDPVSALMAEVDALDALGSAWQRSAEVQAAVAAAKSELLARGERESQAAFEAEQERIDQLDTERQATMAQLEQMATEGSALAARVAEAGEDVVRNIVVGMADTFDDLAGGLAGGISDLAGALAESGQLGKEAAMKAFRVSQAAALAQIAIDTTAGAVKAVAQLGPIAGAIAAAGVTASGIAAGIQVANTPPPQFFAGGMVTAAPDAIPAVLHSGEVVQTAASVRRETGGDVRSRNSGAAQPPATYIQNIVDGRVVSQVIGNEAKRPGSTVRATVGTGIYGQRRRY
jgi:hypothetical protein